MGWCMLKIYNSFSRKKEPFIPLIPGSISLYVCGITVYDYCHLGHARVFVAFDIMVRFLRSRGWKVNYIRNITDIDDKIIKRAHENKESVEALTQRFIQAMQEDEQALNVLAPDQTPKATQAISEIVEMIQRLEEQGKAYVAQNGDVYFSVEQYAPYGALANKKLDQLKAGARVEVAEVKRSVLDFVLWKKAKIGEPAWDSPWGKGRPGWHIECSAMSTKALGTTFDIHGGGADLLFPHHENEKAQSEGATGKPFVRYWMHVGFVQVDKEKMSKSLGNFFTIRDVLAKYDWEVVRYFLLASHYRSPVHFSDAQLEKAKNALNTLYGALRELPQLIQAEKHTGVCIPEYYQRFCAAMEDDFNTPVALSVLFDCVHAYQIAKEKQDAQAGALAWTLKVCANMLGILERDANAYLQGDSVDSEAIEQLIQDRELARAKKDWKTSDRIREQLFSMGVVLEDTASGTIWRKR